MCNKERERETHRAPGKLPQTESQTQGRHKTDTRQTQDRHETDTRQTQDRHKTDTRQTQDRHTTDRDGQTGETDPRQIFHYYEPAPILLLSVHLALSVSFQQLILRLLRLLLLSVVIRKRRERETGGQQPRHPRTVVERAAGRR
jgi:Flp pilus assembly protein TadB